MIGQSSLFKKNITTEEPVPDPKKPTIQSIFAEIKNKRFIKTLIAFIGFGVAIAEFSHHILVNHYGLPHQTVDLGIITIVAGLICTLAWQWSREVKGPRKIKAELILIPFVILIALFLDVRLILQMDWKTKEGLTDYENYATLSPLSFENSIAVLPIKDFSPYKDQGLLCSSIHEFIMDKLRLLIPNLQVIPEEMIEVYKKTNKKPLDIGKELGVRTILESELRTEGSTIQMNTWLKSVKDGDTLWQDRFEENFSTVVNIPDEICQEIANKLHMNVKQDQIPINGFCSISKTHLEKSESVLQCPICINFFIERYLLAWLESNDNCPVCKTKLIQKEKEKLTADEILRLIR